MVILLSKTRLDDCAEDIQGHDEDHVEKVTTA